MDAYLSAFVQPTIPGPLDRFKDLARQLVAEPPDDCHVASNRWATSQTGELEAKLLDQADPFIVESLNRDTRHNILSVKEAVKILTIRVF